MRRKQFILFLLSLPVAWFFAGKLIHGSRLEESDGPSNQMADSAKSNHSPRMEGASENARDIRSSLVRRTLPDCLDALGIELQADRIGNATAQGGVILTWQDSGNVIECDEVLISQTTGEIVASGKIRLILSNPRGTFESKDGLVRIRDDREIDMVSKNWSFVSQPAEVK